MSIFTVLYFIYVSSLFDDTSSQILCEGSECCSGYMYDVNSSNCIACRTGFIGKYCERPCPYPMYGDICQQRCQCARKFCNISIGCIDLQNVAITGKELTTETDLGSTKSDYLPLHTKRNNGEISLTDFTAQVRTLSAKTQKETSSTKSAIVIQHTKLASDTELRKNEVNLVNDQNPLLIGIFSFNAMFVMVVILVVFYCVCRRYRKNRKRKKDNSATAIHYHEIDENAIDTNRDYGPLYSTHVPEVHKPETVEIDNFLVEHVNEPLNRERKSWTISDSRYRSSQTSPKHFIHDEAFPCQISPVMSDVHVSGISKEDVYLNVCDSC